MEQLRQEFERNANNGHELGVQVWIEGERYDFDFTDACGNQAESDSVRIFKSLACRAAADACLNGGNAGPEDWKIWLRHLCEVDPNFRITGEPRLTLSEREFQLWKESGEPTEAFVCQTHEFTETDLIEDARWFYSNQVDPRVDFDRFVELYRATAGLPQKGNEPKMPRVGDSIVKYMYKVQRGQLLRIFNASAIRCMELGSLAPGLGTKDAARSTPPAVIEAASEPANSLGPIESATTKNNDSQAAVKIHPTGLGSNVDRLRKECGWSFDELAQKTGLEKKLILGHVNEGKGAYPRTVKTYADAFASELKRPVTVSELEA